MARDLQQRDTPWIAFAAGAMVLAAFAGRKVLIAMVVVLVLSVLFVPAIGDRFQELGSDNSYNTYRRDSLEWRIAYWTDIIPLANANPVTGIGLKPGTASTRASHARTWGTSASEMRPSGARAMYG